MAVAIDASSPAGVSTNGSSIATASFTPPAGALLVACATSTNAVTAPYASVSDSRSGTWTYKCRAGTAPRSTIGIIAISDSPGASMTVTMASSGSASFFTLKVYVITGAAVAASQTGTTLVTTPSTDVAPTVTMTPTAIGSLLVGCTPNFNNTSLSAAANTTLDWNATASGFGQSFHLTALTSATSSTSYGLTPTTANNYEPTGLEVLAGGGGAAATIPNVIMAQMGGR